MTLSHFTVVFGDMARPEKLVPTYLTKKPNLARLLWRGETRSLPGKYNSAESWAEFNRLCAIVAATGSLPHVKSDVKTLTIKDLGKRYLKAMTVKFGKESKEPQYLSYAVRDCIKLFGSSPADAFSPPELKAVRASILKSGCVRRTANKRTQQIIRMFRWAVEEGLTPADQWQRLLAVEPIGKGHYGAVDNPKVQPVSTNDMNKALEFVSDEARDALKILAITGMRTGELLRMRPQDCDMSGRHWIYKTEIHKTGRKTGATSIVIPEPATLILSGRMPRDFTKPWFRHGLSWLRLAVCRACVKAGIPHWHPHQLRHQMATRVAESLTRGDAQKLLRHHDPKMTDHYAVETDATLLRIADQLYPDVKIGGGGG
jgi:integrase